MRSCDPYSRGMYISSSWLDLNDGAVFEILVYKPTPLYVFRRGAKLHYLAKTQLLNGSKAEAAIIGRILFIGFQFLKNLTEFSGPPLSTQLPVLLMFVRSASIIRAFQLII